MNCFKNDDKFFCLNYDKKYRYSCKIKKNVKNSNFKCMLNNNVYKCDEGDVDDADVYYECERDDEHKVGIKHKNNSCWMDSILICIFYNPPQIIIDNIINRTEKFNGIYSNFHNKIHDFLINAFYKIQLGNNFCLIDGFNEINKSYFDLQNEYFKHKQMDDEDLKIFNIEKFNKFFLIDDIYNVFNTWSGHEYKTHYIMRSFFTMYKNIIKSNEFGKTENNIINYITLTENFSGDISTHIKYIFAFSYYVNNNHHIAYVKKNDGKYISIDPYNSNLKKEIDLKTFKLEPNEQIHLFYYKHN